MSTLTRGHGLTDVTPLDARIENITLRVESAGTFQEFNDAIGPLGRIWYFDNLMPRWLAKGFDLSAPLASDQIGLRDILARMPSLAEKYRHTFGSTPKAIPIALNVPTPNAGCWTLRIDDPNLFSDRAGLVEMLRRLRASYPFLARWHFVEAVHAWGYSILNFNNSRIDTETTNDDDLIEGTNGSYANRHLLMMTTPPDYVAAEEILPPLSGGYVYSSAVFAMEPIAGVRLNEHSLQFLGTFLLGSLVRYRPLSWQSAISRSISAEAPADDRSLALIEEFLEDVLTTFPAMVVRTIDYQRTR